MTIAKDRKSLLSTLWIFAMLNYVYADLLMIIVNPAAYQKAVTGMNGTTVLGFAVLMEIPIAMVLLSRVLPYRINRLANIVAGVESTAFVAFTLGGKPPLYYTFFSMVEILCSSCGTHGDGATPKPPGDLAQVLPLSSDC